LEATLAHKFAHIETIIPRHILRVSQYKLTPTLLFLFFLPFGLRFFILGVLLLYYGEKALIFTFAALGIISEVFYYLLANLDSLFPLISIQVCPQTHQG